MTNDEAIEELKDWHDMAQFDGNNRTKSMREVNAALAEALEMAMDALQPWRVITKRPMTFVEKKDYAESSGWEIAEEDAFIYENLPEDGKEVLVCTWYGHIFIDTLYSDDQGCYFDNHGEIEGVIAWMPLPEPYKGGEK